MTQTQRRERSTSKLNKNHDIEGNIWSIKFLGLDIVEICDNSESLIVDAVMLFYCYQQEICAKLDDVNSV